jgi:phage tail sheath protein FI
MALKPEQLNNFKAGQNEMLKHCARMGDRSAILDSPRGAETGKGANKIEDWPSAYQRLPLARYGALYYPWIREKAADFKGVDLTLPPSGHIAGVFTRTESRVSVGHAPANEVVHGIVEFEFCLSDAEQAILNPHGVNCLRSFPGRGLLVWGARTMSADPTWRYVNVVRVMLATIKQILINLRWTVFEPNDQKLWDRIVATLTLFLRDLFERGVLVGAKPEEAFFVKCDEETNPPEVIDRGEVITRVGLAPARPAEFVVVTIKRTSESVSVSEGLAGRR